MINFLKTLKPYLLLMPFMVSMSFAQVGIGTNTPHASAALDVQSPNKGVLTPRLEASVISSMTGMANGLLVYAISTDATITSTGFWYYNGSNWKKLGEGASIYTEDGTLVNNRVVNLSDKTLTFNSTTGRMIVDAPFESRKALYARPVRLHPIASSITWQNEDVVIQLQNGHSGAVILPNATLNSNRMVGISNRSGSARDMAFVNSTAFGLYASENLSQLPHNSVIWFQSDGVSWNVISTNGQTTNQNGSFAPNVTIVGKVAQSSNFIVGSTLPAVGAFVDVQITTTGTSFPYLVSLSSNLVNGFYLKSDIVTITQSPAIVRLVASGFVNSLVTGTTNFMVTASALNGAGQTSIPVELAQPSILSQLSIMPSAAYSTRRLNINYGGPLIRVFKSVGGVVSELDVFITPSGDLDTQSLMTFAGTARVSIKTWYDQSGNGNHVVTPNSNFNAAPVIVDNSSLVAINSKASANFHNFGFKTSGLIPSVTIGECQSVVEVTTAPNGINRRLLGSTAIQFTGSGASFSISAAGTRYVNGNVATTVGLVKASVGVAFTNPSTFGSVFGNVWTDPQSNSFPGKISELILFSTNLSGTDRQILNNNQIEYYGL